MFSDFEPKAENRAASLEKSSESGREPVRIMLIGSKVGIDVMVKLLHQLGFAEVGDWSKPQTYPNSDKLMSVLTKWIRH